MKKITNILLCFLLLITLSGCMKVNIGLVIEDETNYEATVEMLLDKDMMTAYGYSDEEIAEMLIADSDIEGDVEYKSVTRTIDGKEWVGVMAEGSTADLGDISQYISKETINGKESLVLRMDMSELSSMTDTDGMEAYSIDQMKALGMEMTFSVTMPSHVVANMGNVDGNTVTIDLLDIMVNPPQDDELVVSAVIGGNNIMLYIGVGCAVVVAVVILVFVLKKKKNKAAKADVEAEKLDTDADIDKPEEKKDAE